MRSEPREPCTLHPTTYARHPPSCSQRLWATATPLAYGARAGGWGARARTLARQAAARARHAGRRAQLQARLQCCKVGTAGTASKAGEQGSPTGFLCVEHLDGKGHRVAGVAGSPRPGATHDCDDFAADICVQKHRSRRVSLSPGAGRFASRFSPTPYTLLSTPYL
jgi:hypothetical protein